MSINMHQQTINITLASDPKQICVARTAVETFSEREGFAKEQSEQIGLAVNEAVANVIKHGYHGQTDQPIKITMEMTTIEDRSCLKIVMRDHGRQVDPDCIKGRDLDEVRPGGLGVHLMRTVMDQVEYRCLAEGGMELTMLKFRDT